MGAVVENAAIQSALLDQVSKLPSVELAAPVSTLASSLHASETSALTGASLQATVSGLALPSYSRQHDAGGPCLLPKANANVTSPVSGN